jgi:hypothetical protein
MDGSYPTVEFCVSSGPPNKLPNSVAKGQHAKNRARVHMLWSVFKDAFNVEALQGRKIR